MGKLYILHNRRWFFGSRYKIGITKGAVSKRSFDIAESGQKNRVVFWTRLLNERKMETTLHRRYKKMNRTGTGSGKTEWFAISPFEVAKLKMELTARSWGQQLLVLIALLAVAIIFQNVKIEF